jgi:hypothetical protein
MEKCQQQFRQWIWLAAYKELPVDQQKILEEHIKDCPECQLDYEEAMKTIKLFDQKVQLEPTDVQLETNRAELHQRLLLMTQPGFQKKWLAKLWHIISLDFAPALRFATAAAILIVGIFLGKIFFSQDTLKLASGQQPSPGLFGSTISNIESIQYDPTTRQVSIIMNTLNDVIIQGNLDKPEIQQMLTQALMTDERPNVRLKTVRALQNMKVLDKKVIHALSDVVDNEENAGIRLKAVKLLTSIPITSSVKEILTRVLVRVFLNDSNSAIRIEAFKGLSKLENGSIAPVIFNAAKNDSSEYIRSKANQILERTENPVVPE